MFRVVALDLDGTTLRSDGTMSSATTATLEAITAVGVKVVPVTARSPGSTLPLVPSARVAVCCNGAIVVDREDSILTETTLDSARLIDFVAWSQSAVPGLGFGVRCGDLLVGDTTYFGLRRQESPLGSIEVASPAELAGFAAHMLSFRASGMTSTDLAEAVRHGLSSDFGQLSISAGEVLDVAPTGVTKATGLAQLGSLRGFSRTDVIAYGDMPNDIAMLSWAGLGVAVAGAHPDVLAAADMRIGHPDNDAVAAHLRSLFDLGG